MTETLTHSPTSWPPPAPEPVEPGPIWLTIDQREVDTRALSLWDHPAVVAARASGVERLRTCMQFAVTDGPRTLEPAVDNLLFGILQAAVNDDPTRPKVIWSERLPYTAGGMEVPGCRYAADTPDRVYRGVGVSTEHRYEITGRRDRSHPTDNDFSVEAIPWPAMWGSATNTVQAPNGIDLNPDGTWTVIADCTPTDGRRNHLHLPPGTASLLIRDTLHEWGSQVPNEVTVRVLDAEPAPERSRDEVAATAVSMFARSIELSLGLFDGCFEQPVNELHAFYRGVNWGVAGGVIAYNRFDLADDESLIMTLDMLTGEYLGINTSCPWMSSVPCDARTSCLNDRQLQAEPDGSYTVVLGPADPGVHNWLDTGGLRSGVVWIRWERFAEAPKVTYYEDEETRAARWAERPWSYEENRVEGAVRNVRVVKTREIADLIAAGQDRVTPEQRAQLRADRLAAYQVRVTGTPVRAQRRVRT